jgi:hypothetical protein
MRKRLCITALFALSLPLVAAVFAGAGTHRYEENFTSKQYCDTLNTTAWWDTVSGELELPPFELTLAGTYDTPGSAFGIAIAGDHAFVADYGSGLQVIDISDPTSPSIAGSYDTPGNAYGVAISGDYAFVADYGSRTADDRYQ